MARRRKSSSSDGTFITLLFGFICLIIFSPIFPIIIAICIIYGIISIILSVKKSKIEKEQKKEAEILLIKNTEIRAKTDAYLERLDTMSDLEFQDSVIDLVTKATNAGYYLYGYNDEDMTINYYQSMTNIGVALVRDFYGDKFVPNRMIITNRDLTTKAKEFCRNGRIVVVSRKTLSDMFEYLCRQD